MYQQNINCLLQNDCLNDTVINYYIMYLYYEVLSDNDRKRSYFFNTFFYPKLLKYATITTTTNQDIIDNINIFEKEFLMVPINEW